MLSTRQLAYGRVMSVMSVLVSSQKDATASHKKKKRRKLGIITAHPGSSWGAAFALWAATNGNTTTGARARVRVSLGNAFILVLADRDWIKPKFGASLRTAEG